jgi:anti-sigma factor RsiW
MKCLETEQLISYAYHLVDKAAASEVGAHLAECPRCSTIVEQYGRLDALLDEWKVAEPSAWFDARVRRAVEAQPAAREPRGFWSREWARSLTLAALGILIVAGVAWFARRHSSAANSPGVAVQSPQPSKRPQRPAQTAKLRSPVTTPHAGVKLARPVPGLKSVDASWSEDNDAQALEDYDLAANFDLLSEVPKGEPRVAN